MSIDGFDFAGYLTDCNVTGLANVINLNPVTWAVLLIFLWPVRLFMAIQPAWIKLLLVWSCGFGIWLINMTMLADLRRIRFQLHGVPHLGLPQSEHELAEALAFHAAGEPISDAILRLPPPYLRGNLGVRHSGSWLWHLVFGHPPNRHENLLVGGSRGKDLMFEVLRELVFLQSVYLAVVVIRFWSVAASVHVLLPIAYIIFPISNVCYYFNEALDQLSIVTSIGMMPNKDALRMALLSTKVHKLMNAMRLLNKLSLMSAASNEVDVPPAIAQIFRKAAPSGKLTGRQFKNIVPTLGPQYRMLNLNSIDDTWVLGLKEFAVVLQDEDEKAKAKGMSGKSKTSEQRIKQLVEETWSKIDEDGSGAISAREFVEYIKKAGGETSEQASKADELCAMMILREADQDHDGLINKEELVHLLHKYTAN
jgi:hypothetical protein